MLTRDILSDFFTKGLPTIGTAIGGIYAMKATKWYGVLGYCALGWGTGWSAARLFQWASARAYPGLPDTTADLTSTGWGGHDPASPEVAPPAAISGIKYVNLEQEKARLREEAIEKRRARRGKKVEAMVAEAQPSSSEETKPSTAIVPLAKKPSMMYSGLRMGKNVLGVTRR